MARKKTKEKISSNTKIKENLTVDDINPRVYKNLLEIEYGKGNFYAIPDGLYNKEIPEDMKRINILREYFLYQNPKSSIMFPEGLFDSLKHIWLQIEVMQKNAKKNSKVLEKEKLRKLRVFENMTDFVTHQKEMPIEKLAEKKIGRLTNSRNRFSSENILDFADSYKNILDTEHLSKEDKKILATEPNIFYEKQQQKLIELVKLLSRVGCLQELIQTENKNIDIINYYLAKVEAQPIVKVSEKYLLEQIRNLDMLKKENIAVMQVYSIVLLNKLANNYEEYLKSIIYFNIVDDNKFRNAIESCDTKHNESIIKQFDSYLRNETSEEDILRVLKQVNSIDDPEIYLTDVIEERFKQAFESNELIMGLGELPLGNKQLKDTHKFKTYYKKLIENYIDISLDGMKKPTPKFQKDRNKLIEKIKVDKEKLIEDLSNEGNVSKKLIQEIKAINEEVLFNQIRTIAENAIKRDFAEAIEKIDRSRFDDIRKYIIPARNRISIQFSKIQFVQDCIDELEEFRKKYNRIKTAKINGTFYDLINFVCNSEVQVEELQEDELNLVTEIRNYINNLKVTGIIKNTSFLTEVAKGFEAKSKFNEPNKQLLQQLLLTDRKYVYFQNNTILGNQQPEVKRAGTVNILLNNHAQVFGGHYLSNDFEYSNAKIQSLDGIPQEVSNGFKANNGLNLRVSVPMRHIDTFQKRAFRDLYIIMYDIDNETSTHVSLNLISLYNELRDFKLDHLRQYQALKITCLLGSSVKYYRMFSQGRDPIQSMEKSQEKDRQMLEELKNKEDKKQDNQEASLRNLGKVSLWKSVNDEGNQILNKVEEVEDNKEVNVEVNNQEDKENNESE